MMTHFWAAMFLDKVFLTTEHITETGNLLVLRLQDPTLVWADL